MGKAQDGKILSLKALTVHFDHDVQLTVDKSATRKVTRTEQRDACTDPTFITPERNIHIGIARELRARSFHQHQ